MSGGRDIGGGSGVSDSGRSGATSAAAFHVVGMMQEIFGVGGRGERSARGGGGSVTSKRGGGGGAVIHVEVHL